MDSQYSTPTEAKLKTATVNIDPDGDILLTLLCEEGTTYFRVDSYILCTASSVFAAMLGRTSRFKEATDLRAHLRLLRSQPSTNIDQPPPLEIPLEDDSPYALGLVLWAAHWRSDMLPSRLSVEWLYDVAVITDKYDMRRVMAIWAKEWMWCLNPMGAKSVLKPEWLMVSWTFGQKQVFEKATRHAIIDSRINKRGKLAYDYYLPEKDAPRRKFDDREDEEDADMEFDIVFRYVPQRIIDAIVAKREMVLTVLLEKPFEVLRKYEFEQGPNQTCRMIMSEGSMKTTCRKVILSLLKYAFRTIKVPIPPPPLPSLPKVDATETDEDADEDPEKGSDGNPAEPVQSSESSAADSSSKPPPSPHPPPPSTTPSTPLPNPLSKHSITSLIDVYSNLPDLIPFHLGDVTPGCCLFPELSIPPTPERLCVNCQDTWAPAQTRDHAKHCPPTADFRYDVKMIGNRVTGLQLFEFNGAVRFADDRVEGREGSQKDTGWEEVMQWG